jgi:hypothetical protein
MSLTAQGQETLAELRRHRFHDLPLRLAVLRTALELAEFSPKAPTLQAVTLRLQERRHVPISEDAIPRWWLSNWSDFFALH